MGEKLVAIENIQIKLSELEAENSYLKSLLDQAGIAYLPICKPESSEELYVQNQGARIMSETITHNHARRFFTFFWGRLDVYSKRSQNKTSGKAGYYPQCDNFWRRGICPKASGVKIKCKDCTNRCWTKLEAYQIVSHLQGNKEDSSDVIGIYPLFPDGSCRFLVFDFDNHTKGAEEQDFANTNDSWKEEVDTLRKIGQENGIPMLVERSRSGRGAHIWIFFDNPISASLVRKFGFALLEKGAETVNMTSFRFYDRMLPAQDYLEDGELGNLIALPLQGQAVENGNSAFIDENWNAYPDQWDTLLSMQRLSVSKLEELLQLWNVPMEEAAVEGDIINIRDDTKPWERSKQFHGEDVSGELSITLSNLIYIETSNLRYDSSILRKKKQMSKGLTIWLYRVLRERSVLMGVRSCT